MKLENTLGGILDGSSIQNLSRSLTSNQIQCYFSHAPNSEMLTYKPLTNTPLSVPMDCPLQFKPMQNVDFVVIEPFLCVFCCELGVIVLLEDSLADKFQPPGGKQVFT
jgi:hypothetical protein